MPITPYFTPSILTGHTGFSWTHLLTGRQQIKYGTQPHPQKPPGKQAGQQSPKYISARPQNISLRCQLSPRQPEKDKQKSHHKEYRICNWFPQKPVLPHIETIWFLLYRDCSDSWLSAKIRFSAFILARRYSKSRLSLAAITWSIIPEKKACIPARATKQLTIKVGNLGTRPVCK